MSGSTTITSHKETRVKFDAIEPGVYPELIYPAYKSTVKRGPPWRRCASPRPVPVTRNIVAGRASCCRTTPT
jgi:hypothetical protein